MDQQTSIVAEAADSLALAVITSSNTPVLLLDGDLKIIAASTSFCDAFEADPEKIAGRPLAALGQGEWDVPQLGSLLKATAAGSATIESYEMDLKCLGKDARCLLINARRLDYFDAENVRLVVSISDVTDARVSARLKDDLLREKAILLQELQHRVANSLQIIASILMQSAKSVRSRQAQTHLRDASNRVISIAALQQHLAASQIGQVALRAYFTDLCASIAASMIGTADHLSLQVTADDTVTDANVSVSLGLIITELVINALKHAFPEHPGGTISVDYRSSGKGWTLTVSDTGVGMPRDSDKKRGLGSGIVEALAEQLGASVHIQSSHSGTTVAIVHP